MLHPGDVTMEHISKSVTDLSWQTCGGYGNHSTGDKAMAVVSFLMSLSSIPYCFTAWVIPCAIVLNTESFLASLEKGLSLSANSRTWRIQHGDSDTGGLC